MGDDGIRLNKFLSGAGICSRREADRLIEEGKVTVGGRTAVPGQKIKNGETVVCNGRTIAAGTKGAEKKPDRVLLAVHKPCGIVCTTSDKDRAPNIVDMVDSPVRIYPVGRLDKDSEGLILMTNQGDLVNRLMRGTNGHEKEYLVFIDRPVKPEFIQKMRKGVFLPELDVTTKPCFAEMTGEKSFRIVLTQGLNRQIRRMCEQLGCKVRKLKRVRIMNIELGDLKAGESRPVSKKEYAELMRRLEDTSGLSLKDRTVNEKDRGKNEKGRNEDRKDRAKNEYGRNEDLKGRTKNEYGRNEDLKGRTKNEKGRNEDQKYRTKNEYGRNEDLKGRTKNEKGRNEDQKYRTKNEYGRNEDLKGRTKNEKGRNEDQKYRTKNEYGRNEDLKGRMKNEKDRNEDPKYRAKNEKGWNEDLKDRTKNEKGRYEDTKGHTKNEKVWNEDPKYRTKNEKVWNEDPKYRTKNEKGRNEDQKYRTYNEKGRNEDTKGRTRNEKSRNENLEIRTDKRKKAPGKRK